MLHSAHTVVPDRRRGAPVAIVLTCLLASAATATAQDRRGREPAARADEQVESFTRRIRIEPDARVALSNVAGNITITRVSGDELRIDAVKRTRGDRAELDQLAIDVVERTGRVTIATQMRRANRRTRSGVRVDYTLGVPGTASVDLQSVSGTIQVDDVRGAIRAQTMSGDVTITRSPRVEVAKSVAGRVNVSDLELTGNLELETMSGNIVLRQVKGGGLRLSTVTGDASLTDVAAERLEMKSISGDLHFAGSLARTGRYAFNSHSGDLTLVLAGNTGFELNANTFSGEISSAIPVTLGANGGAGNNRRNPAGRGAVRAVFGDGSAVLEVHTFSGDITINRK